MANQVSRITDRQLDVLEYIYGQVTRGNEFPTLKEMQRHFDYKSHASIQAFKTKLQDRGALDKDGYGLWYVTDRGEELLRRHNRI